MGILSDFFLADASPVPNYDGGRDVDEADKRQYKGITPLQAAQFLATLRGVKYEVAMIGEFPFLTPDDADEWTMSVPADMVDRLAAIGDSRIPDLAADFAAATAEEWNATPEDCLPIARGLVELARRADASGKTMYLWNSL